MKEDEVRRAVRKKYSAIAKEGASCCTAKTTCECGHATESKSERIGYSQEELSSVPKGANMGLGCGNPLALLSLKKGEVVLDLGSGGGFDAFLASRRVGEGGRVIGVDMTPEMLEKARKNATKGHYRNVEFRLGEIENLPVANDSVDVVISNCVINLSPDKDRVFNEAYRVLKVGGRLMVSDIVLLEKLPNFLRHSIEALTGCIGGAMLKDDYIHAIESARFKNVSIVGESVYPITSLISNPEIKSAIKRHKVTKRQVDDYAQKILSVKVQATK